MEGPDGTAEAAAPEVVADIPDAAVASPNAPTGEAAEAPAAEETAEDTQNVFLQELFGDKPASWIETQDALLEKEGADTWKGINVQETLDGITDPEQRLSVQRLLHNARNLGLKGSDQAARNAQLLDQRSQKLDEAEHALTQERAKLFAIFKDEQFQAMAKPPEGVEPDFMRDPEGYVRWQIQKGNAEFAKQWGESIGKVGEKHQAHADKLLAEQHKEDAKVELRTFIKDEAPDFHDHGDEIEAAMQKFGMRAQEAYRWVLMEKGLLNQKREDPVKAARRRMRTKREAEIPEVPEGLEGAELWDWHEAHPEARKRPHKSTSLI